jgi:hypothetical protein
MVDADAIRSAGQVEPAPRLDPGADREHEQRVAARVGDVAPRPPGPAVDAGDVRGSKARGGARDDPPARVAQLDDALATQQHHAAPAGQLGDVAGRSRGGRKLRHAGRAAPGKHAGSEQGARS